MPVLLILSSVEDAEARIGANGNMEGHELELDPEVVTTIRRITDRFIRLAKCTPVHEIKSKLGAKRRALDGLVQGRVIQVWGESYLPCLRAVTDFEGPDVQKACFRWTDMVLRALRLVYVREGGKDCNREQVADTALRMMEIPEDPDGIRVGMLFATKFSGFFGGYVNATSGVVLSIRVTEGILDFDTIGSAWQNELEKRNSALAERARLASQAAPSLDNPADLDSLLGLYNRGRFDRDLPELSSGASAEAPLSMIMIDLDGFKQVNDTRGHAAGDGVLKVVGSQVKSSCLDKGLCYRWGGDEIAILLKNYTVAEAMALGERIRNGIERSAVAWQVTASVGVAGFPGITEKREQLLADADGAMYAAKNAGGNQVRQAEPASASDANPSPVAIGVVAAAHNKPFRWDEIDHSLVALRLADLSEDMRKEIAADERRIRFENRSNQNAATVPAQLLEMQERATDEWARRTLELYSDVWKTQGHSRSADFLRAVYANGIGTLIQTRTSTVTSEFELFAKRTNYSSQLLQGQLRGFRMKMQHVDSRWKRKLEAEAKECEHAERVKSGAKRR